MGCCGHPITPVCSLCTPGAQAVAPLSLTNINVFLTLQTCQAGLGLFRPISSLKCQEGHCAFALASGKTQLDEGWHRVHGGLCHQDRLHQPLYFLVPSQEQMFSLRLVFTVECLLTGQIFTCNNTTNLYPSHCEEYFSESMLGCSSWILTDNHTEHDSVENWGHWTFATLPRRRMVSQVLGQVVSCVINTNMQCRDGAAWLWSGL